MRKKKRLPYHALTHHVYASLTHLMKRVIKLAGTLSLVLLLVALLVHGYARSWRESRFALPDGSARIVLLRRATHPYLAKYERRVRVEMPGRQPFLFDLAPDTGDTHHIDLYRQSAVLVDGSEARVLRLRDRLDIH